MIWRAIDGLYGWVLRWSLRHRWVIVVTTLALFAATFQLFKVVGFDFIPRDDQSEFEVAMILPEGYTLSQADKLFAEIEGRICQDCGASPTSSRRSVTRRDVCRGAKAT